MTVITPSCWKKWSYRRPKWSSRRSIGKFKLPGNFLKPTYIQTSIHCFHFFQFSEEAFQFAVKLPQKKTGVGNYSKGWHHFLRPWIEDRCAWIINYLRHEDISSRVKGIYYHKAHAHNMPTHTTSPMYICYVSSVMYHACITMSPEPKLKVQCMLTL